jgi:hypothetical protein
MSLLDKIGIECGTDKSSLLHDYLKKYEKYLPFDREQPIKILEIGVLEGESLCVWKQYFTNVQIVGIDINPYCKKFESENINIEIGSQSDADFLKNVCEKYGPFDMILDDGSHMNEHVIFTFKELFKYVKPQGVYIVEDSATSYWEYYGGKRYGQNTIMEYFKSIVDEVNFFGEESMGENINKREDISLIQQFKTKGYDYLGTEIESLNFLNSIILITKR